MQPNTGEMKKMAFSYNGVCIYSTNELVMQSCKAVSSTFISLPIITPHRSEALCVNAQRATPQRHSSMLCVEDRSSFAASSHQRDVRASRSRMSNLLVHILSSNKYCCHSRPHQTVSMNDQRTPKPSWCLRSSREKRTASAICLTGIETPGAPAP